MRRTSSEIKGVGAVDVLTGICAWDTGTFEGLGAGYFPSLWRLVLAGTVCGELLACKPTVWGGLIVGAACGTIGMINVAGKGVVVAAAACGERAPKLGGPGSAGRNCGMGRLTNVGRPACGIAAAICP